MSKSELTEEWVVMNQRCPQRTAEPAQQLLSTTNHVESSSASAEIEELVDEICDFHQQVSPKNESQTALVIPNDQQPGCVFSVNDPMVPVKHCIIISCDFSKLTTPVGMLKLIILVTCIVSLSCVCSTDYPKLVLSEYTRFHIFSLTFTFLTILVIFLLELLTLLMLFPVHWARWNAGIHFVVCLLLAFSSTMLIHAQFTNEDSMPRLDRTVELLIVSGVSGYFGALLCMLLSVIACCCYEHHLTSSS